MSFRAKRELLVQVAPRYCTAVGKEKTAILNQFVAATGYDRKYAIRLLKQPTPVIAKEIRRPRQRRYGQEVQEALIVVWAAANCICTKRLLPFLPALVESLERHGHLAVTDEVRRQLLAHPDPAYAVSGGGGRFGSGRENQDTFVFSHAAGGDQRTRIVWAGDYAGTLGVGKQDAVAETFGVRRLTPLECERLQGFPPGWTDGQSDTARYRELGNAVAVPAVEWIGRRLVAVDREWLGVVEGAAAPTTGATTAGDAVSQCDACGCCANGSVVEEC